jgi:hypothetical protein
MGPESQGLMCESTPSKPNPAQVPAPLPAKPELMTESAKDQAFFEAVDAKVLQDDRGMAAASILIGLLAPSIPQIALMPWQHHWQVLIPILTQISPMMTWTITTTGWACWLMQPWLWGPIKKMW